MFDKNEPFFAEKYWPAYCRGCQELFDLLIHERKEDFVIGVQRTQECESTFMRYTIDLRHRSLPLEKEFVDGWQGFPVEFTYPDKNKPTWRLH